MKYTFIGDVHGKFPWYNQIIEECDNSIQVGDLGMGFYGYSDSAEGFDKAVKKYKGTHRFIRGNHDNPNEVKLSKNWIVDGAVERTKAGKKIMFIGGAWSIDQAYRTPEIDWWHDEELSNKELERLVSVYEKEKPDVMVTHTLPISIPAGHMGFRIFGSGSKTEFHLQNMFVAHKPKLWVSGHWHMSFDKVVDGTRFVCLDELKTLEVDL